MTLVVNEHSSMQPAAAEDSLYYHNDESASKILVQILNRQLGQSVLEVGAGEGCITQELANAAQQVVAIEPNQKLFTELRQKTSRLSNVTTLQMTLEEYVRQCGSSTENRQGFDSVVYINVLEHIEQDATELRLATEVLSPTGQVLLVVPAHRWLFSKVDRLSGHFRRYSRSGLAALLRQVGLRPVSIRYFDSVGLLPYLIIYKWLRSTAVSGTNAFLYSRIILPVSRVLYQLSHGRLVGKNLIAVAEVDKSRSARP